MAKKSICLKVDEDKLAHIDQQAKKRGVDRTTYMIECALAPNEANIIYSIEFRKVIEQLCGMYQNIDTRKLNEYETDRFNEYNEGVRLLWHILKA